MRALGAAVISACETGGVITLQGNLGTGKTTLVRGALEARGITTGVRSPSYTLIEYYQLDKLAVAHFDLYRLGDGEELEYIGYRDYLNTQTLCFIEWPERAEGYLTNIGLEINLQTRGEKREIELQSGNDWGQEILRKLSLT